MACACGLKNSTPLQDRIPASATPAVTPAAAGKPRPQTLAITGRIAILLLVPIISALATLAIVYDQLRDTVGDVHMVNVMGRQRLLSQQLLAYAEMVHGGQDEDRPRLTALVRSFDRALGLIENGGEDRGQMLRGAPLEALPEVRAVRHLWTVLVPALIAIAERPPADPEVERIYQHLSGDLIALTAASDRVVDAFQRKTASTRARILRLLGLVAAINAILLVAGLKVTHDYVRRHKRAEAQLRASERRYRDLVELIPYGVHEHDASGVITLSNRAHARMHGYGDDELVGARFSDLAVSDTNGRELAARFALMARAQLSPASFTTQHLTSDGRVMDVQVDWNYRHDDAGRVAGFVCLTTDVTKQKRVDATLRELAEKLAQKTGGTFFEALTESVARILNVDYALVGRLDPGDPGRFQTLAACARGDRTAAFEYPLAGTPCEQVLNGESTCFPADVQKHFPGHRLLTELDIWSYVGIPLIDSAGRVAGLLAVMHTRPVGDVDLTVALLRLYAIRAAAELERQDAETALRESKKRLEFIAHYDLVTGLPNRTLLCDRLEQTLFRARWHKRLVAVMLLDLDRFKNINDTLGHHIGDQLLKEVAERWRRAVRAGDTVARLGGDEFVIVLADVANQHDVGMVARKIIETLDRPFLLDGGELFITTSIGISLHPNDSDVAGVLVQYADVAMYRAKEKGKNNFQFYSPAICAEAPRRLALENDLRRALARGEFVLHYEPKVELKTGRIVGAEALVRWQHPRRGLMPPVEFIPLLEETGLIESVGEWILREACRQAREWQTRIDGQGALGIAVNLSARQFGQYDLTDIVERVLNETGLGSQYLELELTENIFLQESAEIGARWNRLHELGVGIVIDDFGTGYSSLSYLHRFPVRAVKIDRSFVKGVDADPNNAAIVKAVIAMAHSLKIAVVAEGVETDVQLAALSGAGCDAVQGYLFTRPLSAKAFARFVKGGSVIGRAVNA